MYLGVLVLSNCAGIVAAVLSAALFGNPLWLTILVWSLSGTVAMLAWVLYGVTREGVSDDLASMPADDATAAFERIRAA